MEYLARATKEFEQIDAHLTRTERSIVEARGRAVSADKNRKAHRLAPIKPSTLPSFINENFLTGIFFLKIRQFGVDETLFQRKGFRGPYSCRASFIRQREIRFPTQSRSLLDTSGTRKIRASRAK